MKKVLMILALILPLTLMAQEVKEEVKEEVVVKQGCTYNVDGICISCQAPHLNKGKQFRIKKEIRFGSDRGDRRGRMGMQQVNQERKKMHKKQTVRQVVKLAIVGGIAYYVGYHQGEKHFKGGMGMKRRPPYMGNKK